MKIRRFAAGTALATMLAVVGLANPAHAGGYFTVKVNLNLRTCQWLNNPVCTPVLTVIPGGRSIYLNCWAPGTSVNGDNVWYNTQYAGKDGMVSGYYMATGHDPNPAVSRCG